MCVSQILSQIFFSLPLPSGKEAVKPAVEAERRSSFSSQNLEIEDIDTETNPQLVAVYVKDIYKYLNELEVLFSYTLI